MFQFCSLASLSIAERVNTKPAHHTPEPSATKNQMHHHISAITPAQRTAHHELKQQKQQKQRERGQAGTRRQAAHVRAPTGRCSLALQFFSLSIPHHSLAVARSSFALSLGGCCQCPFAHTVFEPKFSLALPFDRVGLSR